NNVCRRLLNSRGLDDVFPEASDAYHVRPDWRAAKDRALQLASALEDYARTVGVDVACVGHNIFVPPSEMPKDAGAALAIYKREIGQAHGSGNYSNRD